MNNPNGEDPNAGLLIKTNDGHIKILFADILYLQASGDYTTIYIEGGKPHLATYRIGELVVRLPVHSFMRIHKSYAVNVFRVNGLKLKHVLIGPQQIPIAKKSKALLRKRMTFNAGE